MGGPQETYRLPQRLVEDLARAAMERKIKRRKPWSQQDIVDEALGNGSAIIQASKQTSLAYILRPRCTPRGGEKREGDECGLHSFEICRTSDQGYMLQIG